VFNCLAKFWQGQAKSREEMEWFSKTLNCEGQVQWGTASALLCQAKLRRVKVLNCLAMLDVVKVEASKD